MSSTPKVTPVASSATPHLPGVGLYADEVLGTDPDGGAVGTNPDVMSPVTPDVVEEDNRAVITGENDEINLGPGDMPSRPSELIPAAVQPYQAWRPEKPDDMSDEEWRLRAFPKAEPIPEPYGDHTRINRPDGVIDEQLNAPATTAPSTYVAATEVPGPNSKADPREVIRPRTEFDKTPESYVIQAPVASEPALEADKAIENHEIAPAVDAPVPNAPLTPPESERPAMAGPDQTSVETEQTSTDPALVNVHSAEQNDRITDPHAREADAFVTQGSGVVPKGPAVDGQDAIRNTDTTTFDPDAVRTVREMEARNAPIEPGDKPVAPKPPKKTVKKTAKKK